MASITFNSGTKDIVERLDTMNFGVNVNFNNMEAFNESIKNGFDPYSWEESPRSFGNKVLIDNIPFREKIKT